MQGKYLFLIFVCGGVLILDQITKWIVYAHLSLHEWIPVSSFLSITFVMNKGAAFGFLSTAPDGFRAFFFIVLSIVAMGVILFLYLKIEGRHVLKRLSFSLILGGASGNMIDRVRFGEVVDFIDLHIGRYHWPAFNIADSAITIGVAILVIQIILGGKRAG